MYTWICIYTQKPPLRKKANISAFDVDFQHQKQKQLIIFTKIIEHGKCLHFFLARVIIRIYRSLDNGLEAAYVLIQIIQVLKGSFYRYNTAH